MIKWIREVMCRVCGPCDLVDCKVDGNKRLYREISHELRSERARSAILMENTTDLIWSTGKNREVLAYNEGFKKELAMAYGIQVCIGETIVGSPLLPESEKDFWNSVYKRVLDGESFVFEREYNYGDLKIVEVSASPVRPNGEIIGATFISRDITEQKQELLVLKEGMSEAIKIIKRNGDR